MLITFDLLDKAPLAGDVANPPVEKDVTTAYNVLMNALNTSTMVITMGSDVRQLLNTMHHLYYREKKRES